MAAKTKTISTLVESQLPSFITSDYTEFSKFVEKYYEQLEIKGQPLDIINNITKYRDINTYENDLLQQTTTLSASILANVTSISVASTDSFPDKNGYIQIGDEICFYKEKTDTQFLYVSRGVSGNTTLGNLYKESEFITTQAAPHYQGDVVTNISNLFLYALVKSFESQYLGAFPEQYLKTNVDKRTLIKNIGKFYKSKGTEKSIKFIFNSIVSKDNNEQVSVYNPKDFTLKSSTSDWTTAYALKVKVVSGDIQKLVGNLIVQNLDDYDKSIGYASAVVDNVLYSGNFEGDDIYELVLQPSSVNGKFNVYSRTTLKNNLSVTESTGDRVDVYSTLGWGKQGKLLIGNEVITFTQKNVNQFIIDTRINPQTHGVGQTVYNYSTLQGTYDTGIVKLITVGVVYNLIPTNPSPYASTNDTIEISDSGFSTRDPIIFDKFSESIRWQINDSSSRATALSPQINSKVNKFISDVSAVYEDDQYYYVCSSSFPSYTSIFNNDIDSSIILEDQKILRLIRKRPTITTEVYKTSTRDVGIFVDGTLAVGYKDEEYVKYGKIVESKVTYKGNGYKSAPFVLVNNTPNKARSVLSGETVDSILIDTDENFTEDPEITITSGRGAKLTAIVTNGKITSIRVDDPGEYYSSPPIIKITDDLGKGSFAEYEAVLSPEGKIESCKSINYGRFYTRETTKVTVEAVGFGAQATASIKKWVKNRYTKISDTLDINNAFPFINYNPTKNYGYGVIANPKLLRYKINDNITAGFSETNTLTHSPILGYAYDGNPIYGPYGHSNPLDSNSSIIRLASGYQLNSSRENGPSIGDYPAGSFIDDYVWVPSINSGKTELDQNNGRFCVTPDYPQGVYAYFLTIDSSNTPVFPYIIGANFYSLPVDSNYNSNISQDDLPISAKRLRSEYSEKNGDNVYCLIQDVKSGNINSCIVESSIPNFSVNNDLIINNSLTEGAGVTAAVATVKGKEVLSLESNQTKAVQISLVSNAYLFEGDAIEQRNSDGEILASGTLIGNVFNTNTFVLRNCEFSVTLSEKKFNLTDRLFSQTKVINVILDKNASFTKGSIVTLTDGKGKEDSDIAFGEILEGTLRQNSLKIKVTSTTDFIIDDNYFLKSSNLDDTPKAKILTILSLSENLEIFDLNDNIAIINTSEPHQLAVGDIVTVDVSPDDTTTETEYYVRKRLYQSAILNEVSHSSTISDTGVGNFTYLNTGLDYQSGTYTDVELVFQDQSLVRNNIGAPGDAYNAKATVVIFPGGFGGVQNIIITDKGKNYRKGDRLTISDDNLHRSPGSINNQRILIEVDHAGFGYNNTLLKLSNVSNLSNDDYLKIGNEIVKITNVDTNKKTVDVIRSQEGTTAVNHYDGKEVSLYEANYRFTDGYRPFGSDVSKPYYISYQSDIKKINVSYSYGVNSPIVLQLSSTFYDNSTPAKLVSIKTVTDPEYQLEFSRDNISFVTNPVIDVQKYYKYKFDTSHYSMVDTYLDFSASANKNIYTEEKYVNNISPGNPGSFLSVKFGFGANISLNNYEDKIPLNYSAFFYFIKASNNVNTEDSFLKIKDDPLTGEKRIIYTTNNKFVYSLSSIPAYDGSGKITYTTSSEYAVGKINSIKILDTGSDYKKVPNVVGVVPTSSKEAKIEAIYDSIKKQIKGVTVVTQGESYSQPKVVVTNGDGNGATFDVVLLDGKIKNVKVVNAGYGYTYSPTLKVIETDLKIYLGSNNIGVPQNVKIIQNGVNFNNDKTTLSSFTSNTVFELKQITKNFTDGEIVTQEYTGASAVVSSSGWRPGTNLLKVYRINGIFESGYPIVGQSSKASAIIKSKIYTEFVPQVKSSYDNIGYYASDRGQLSANSQKLTDSYFYQDYSYVIKSKTPIDVWRDLIKQTTHPAGFQLFGEVLIETEASTRMPTEQRIVESYSCISLPPISLTVVSTKQQITNTLLSVDSLLVERGLGSISVDTFDSSELFSREFGLLTPFNGDDQTDTTKSEGDTVFTMYDKKTNLPLSVSDVDNLIVSLDGIIQEPGKAFVVSGTQLSFSQPPLGERIIEGQTVESQNFYGRIIKFKNNDLNTKYFKSLQDISDQFNGVDRIFELYYKDGSIVKTDENENLLIFLNGVLQKAKQDSLTPYGNSYYILRSDDIQETDKIVFKNPPINPVTTDDLPEKFFGFSVGNYERLTIDSKTIEYRGNGPYLIKDEVTGRVRKIDDASFALVFIDGVLQQEKKSYDIVGPNITFTAPLKKYVFTDGSEVHQNVSIILLYGRDLPKTITAYDYEPDTFYNKITLTVSGSNLIQNFDTLTASYSNHSPEFYSQNVKVFQNNNLLGELKKVDKVSNNIKFTILTPLNDLNLINNNALKFVVNDKNSYTLSGTYTISSQYALNSDGERILVRGKRQPLWLYGYSLGDDIETYRKERSIVSLSPGDLIQIDGENSYREIISVPDVVKQKNYVNEQIITNDLYSKITVTNYNEITRGEGLSINAVIDENGSVIDLIWNKRDLELFFEKNLLLQPTAYQYYTTPIIEFVPQTEFGGGARAEVIAYGGDILDIVLVEGGSGYTEPPKVVVARGYNKIKSNKRKIDSVTSFVISPQIDSTNLIVSTSIQFFLAGQQPNAISIVSFGATFGEIKSDREISSIVTPAQKISTVSYASTGIVDVLLSDIVTKSSTSISPTASIDIKTTIRPELQTTTIASVNREIDRYSVVGLFDYKPSETLTRYGLTNAGFNIGLYENNVFTGSGSSDVSGMTLLEFEIAYPNVTIEQFADRKLSHYMSGGEIFDLVPASVQEFGTYLDAPLSNSLTVIYVTSTTGFPSSGLLLINKEIVRYSSKQSDRFIVQDRGYLNTGAQTHSAGDYIRSIEIADLPLDNILDPGPG